MWVSLSLLAMHGITASSTASHRGTAGAPSQRCGGVNSDAVGDRYSSQKVSCIVSESVTLLCWWCISYFSHGIAVYPFFAQCRGRAKDLEYEGQAMNDCKQ
ncbi:hypothetical protein DFH94DRAFT_767510 [Russula ochroleuca]|jgi:hypothetical protein|uniref:Secreted protein n=1 Tax=Russula ochroleuca TaxID=152965 RepID=A0A9P5K091_9AGAM|nr:hypothetical protein DFH94DRAFT_767510 [Russula ochroleuca]